MKLKNVYTITIFATIAIITGCSANKSGKSYCEQKGRISAHINSPVNDVCKVDFVYRNLSRHPQKPIIEIIAYDASGKIIDKNKMYFPEIKSGASQNMTKALPCENQKIVRIYVSDAVDADRCYGYNCSILCDIKDSTVELTK